MTKILKWYKKQKIWVKGGSIGFLVGIIILLIPLFFVIIMTLIHFGQPKCPRWEGHGSPLCNLSTLLEDILLIYFLAGAVLIGSFIVSVLVGLIIGFIIQKIKRRK